MAGRGGFERGGHPNPPGGDERGQQSSSPSTPLTSSPRGSPSSSMSGGPKVLQGRRRRQERPRGRERRRGTWWHRVEQCELKVGVDFVPDSEGESDNQVQFIPETEPQDLVAMASVGAMTAASEVDPDAETDEFIKLEEQFTTADKIKRKLSLDMSTLQSLGSLTLDTRIK